MPARIVIHKTSKFRDTEIKGFNRVLEEKSISAKDFVSITNTDMRLFSDSNYPPVRGTLLSINENEGILYTRGTIDFYQTYPVLIGTNMEPVHLHLMEPLYWQLMEPPYLHRNRST
jgi:hypothetical protein